MSKLGEPYDGLVADLVRSGRYPTEDDVLRDAVTLLHEREMRRRELGALLEAGVAELDAGMGIPADEVLAELKHRFPRRGAA